MQYRHELKFLVTWMELQKVRYRLEPVLEYDSNQDGDFYTVRSLYLDDIYDSCRFENMSGVDHRAKYRLRMYNGNTGYLHLEKKSKEREMTRKIREKISLEECRALLLGGSMDDAGDWREACLPGKAPLPGEACLPGKAPLPGEACLPGKAPLPGEACLLGKAPLPEEICLPGEVSLPKRRSLACELEYLMQSRGMRPRCIVEYDRCSMVNEVGNVRITLDMNIRGSLQTDLFLDGTSDCFDDALPPNMHILEVKYDELLPAYILEAADLNTLRRQSVSKYCLCRRHCLAH